MKNDKRLDEVFRKGLPSVGVPPPPEQDWAAMARSAKQGVRAAAARDRGASLNFRWMKLLGGASAILAAWYLAFGPQSMSPTPPKANAPSETPTAQAQFMGDAPAALLDLIAEEDTDAPTMTVISPTAIGADDRTREEAAAEGNDRATERMHATDERTNDRSARSVMSPRTWSFDGNTDVSPAEKLNGPGQRQDDAGTSEGSSNLVETPAAASAQATAHAAPAMTSASMTGALGRERIDVLDPRPPLASALPYAPNGPAKETTIAEPSMAHWSIAPWFSLGHSTWTDPENGDDGSLDQLTMGHDQPGSMGLRLQYAFDRRFAVITGIQYARKGSLRGTVQTSPTLSTYYNLSGDYLEVPLSLKFTLPLENKDLYVRAGGLLQFNMHNGSDRVVMTDASRKQMSTLVLARGSMGTALDIGIGAQFRLGPQLGLFIEPSYQYSLSPVVKHPSFDQLPFNPRIHTLSLATGLSFQFP